MKKKLFIIAIIIFLFHLVFRIYDYRDAYLTPYDAAFWEDLYKNSQWVIPNSKTPIGDDGVYTYAGWEYIHGQDPSTLNAELPPLGKYLIGISEVVFLNQNIFALFSGILFLGALYYLGFVIFNKHFFAFLPVLLISLEPLFYTQLRVTLLDTLYGGLLFFTFAFFIKKKYIISFLFLGLAAATKSAISTFALVLFVTCLFLLITKQWKEIKRYVIGIPFAALTFLLSYIQYFSLGNSFIEFLKVQKWIVTFYADGAKGSLTAPWELLFTGSYSNWFGTTTQVTDWHFGWTILLLLSLASIYILIRKRIMKPVSFLGIWILAYLLFLSLVPIWPRYFLLLLPSMYIVSLWVYMHYVKVKKVY